jgi:uncharacterized small protein (DUF1192 family)
MTEPKTTPPDLPHVPAPLMSALPQLGALAAVGLMLWSQAQTTNNRIDALSEQLGNLRVQLEVRSAGRWTRDDHQAYADLQATSLGELRERVSQMRSELREVQADVRDLHGR